MADIRPFFERTRMTTASTLQLHVKGMTCQHCVKAVTKALQTLDSAATVNVELPQGLVTVQTSLARDAAVQAITEEGYEVLA
jgi:copper chaperone